MAVVQTAAGALDTAQLGLTLMHEHLLFGYPAVRAAWPHSFDRAEALARVVGRVTEAKLAGIDTLVDCTGVDIGRDAAFAVDVVRQTGMHIILATGFVLEVPRYFLGRNASVAANLLLHDLQVGMDGTTIRAGIIKAASHAEQVTGLWELAFRAAARAHRSSGVPITTHTDSSVRSGIDQQRILAEEGVDLSRVIIGHSGDTEDLDYLQRLLDRGSYLGMDRFGLDQFAGRPMTTQQRCAVIARLCRAGYASQLVLSHDATCYCVHTLQPPHSGGYETAQEALAWWDRTYPDMKPSKMTSLVTPTLLEVGVPRSDIDLMLHVNPKTIFDNQVRY